MDHLGKGSLVSATATSPAASRFRRSGEDWIAPFHHTGEERALAVESYLPLARRYARDADVLEDLVQVASLGLVNAIKRFDPERGVWFTSFAAPTITGELRRYFRSSGWSLHVVRRAVARHYREHGRAPRVSDLAALKGLDAETITEALQADRVQATVSLDRPAMQVSRILRATVKKLSGQLADHDGRDRPG